MANVVEDGVIAGASVAIFRGDQPIHIGAYGFANVEAGTAAEPRTLFNIGSVTKILTAAALLTLAESGVLSLDDSLLKWVPEFPNMEQGRQITLRHLVSHTSGLSEYGRADLDRWERTGEPLTRKFVLSFLRDKVLEYEPGSHWAYNNSGFFLAGLVIEAASGRSWANHIQETVLQPLGVGEIQLCDDVVESRSRGYEFREGALQPAAVYVEAGVRGDGGICTSARALARVLIGLDEGRVLGPATRADMVAPTRLPSGVTVSYGLGVRLGSLQGHDLWGHTGGHAGIIAVAARYPNDELTIVVQINTVRSDFDALVLEGQIAATILGLNQEPPAPSAPASRQLEAYAGEYIGVPGEPSQIITVKDGLLSVASSGSESGRRLLPLARDTFFRESDPYPMDRYVFETVGGRVEGYSAFYNGFHGAFYQRLRR